MASPVRPSRRVRAAAQRPRISGARLSALLGVVLICCGVWLGVALAVVHLTS